MSQNSYALALEVVSLNLWGVFLDEQQFLTDSNTHTAWVTEALSAFSFPWLVNMICNTYVIILPGFPASSSQPVVFNCGSSSLAAGRLLGSCSSSVGAESRVLQREHCGATLPGFALVISETCMNYSLLFAQVSSFEKGDIIIVSETFKWTHQIFLASLCISATTDCSD